MELFWNAGRLTDLGALLLAVVVTVAILWLVIARAYQTEPARLTVPSSWRVAWTRWHAAQKG